MSRNLFKFFLFAAVCLAAGGSAGAAEAEGGASGTVRGLTVTARDAAGTPVTILYENSYALVVGVSDYTGGWPKLPSVATEIADVAAALRGNGFEVTVVMDPDADELKRAFETFVSLHGYDPGNRLLFFFSGHGYNLSRARQSPTAGYMSDVGYIVPADAPDPRKGMQAFLRSALSMEQIRSWCEQMFAGHVLFVFDSCFSGTIFKTRALGEAPPHISSLTARPVRAFITAGDAGEEVPATSVFTPSFIRGISGEADLSKDGYVTGTELGSYLHDKVVDYRTGQTPQFGKIRNPRLDEGDFVFVPGSFVPPTNAAATPGQVIPSPDRAAPAIALDAIPASVTEAKLTVTGRATDDRGIEKLTADGTHLALSRDGRFSVTYTLGEGKNTLTFVARDEAGNEATRTAEVTYAPPRTPAPAVAPSGGREPYEPELVWIPGGTFQMGSPASEADRANDESRCIR